MKIVRSMSVPSLICSDCLTVPYVCRFHSAGRCNARSGLRLQPSHPQGL